ncbi:MAG: 3(2), 5-bisphosphate nucleotidase [Frankiales bacterium]|nr:3(2), 5-bisphosphate nucleotidase [Frankiales bacterium]
MDDDDLLAAAIAEEAGGLLLGLRASLGFDDPARLRAAGDRQAHELIAGRLAEARPGDAVLSEEAADSAERLTARRVWIVDPLDGTREYGESGRADWAVHVALWERGAGLVAGAVALPAQALVLSAGSGEVAGDEWRLPRSAGQRSPGAPRVVVSRTRPPAEAERVLRALDGVPLPMGSAGAKIAAVVRGEAEVYVHSGGQYQWDSAAPVAVALAAGLHASRVDGSPLVYNEPDLRLPDLVVCVPALAEAVLGAIA